MTDDIVARLRRHARVPFEKIERKAAFNAAKRVVKDLNADILDRLRAIVVVSGGVTNSNVDHIVKAADEIERLRLEMSIPRDEYAMTWKNLLDRIDGLDIVEWIRAYANAYSPSDYSSPIAREVVVRSDKRWLEAADEIERLRARVAELEAERAPAP